MGIVEPNYALWLNTDNRITHKWKACEEQLELDATCAKPSNPKNPKPYTARSSSPKTALDRNYLRTALQTCQDHCRSRQCRAQGSAIIGGGLVQLSLLDLVWLLLEDEPESETSDRGRFRFRDPRRDSLTTMELLGLPVRFLSYMMVVAAHLSFKIMAGWASLECNPKLLILCIPSHLRNTPYSGPCAKLTSQNS